MTILVEIIGILDVRSPALPLSLDFVCLAIAFLSLMVPDALSFLGRILAAAAGSTRLISELDATDAGGWISRLDYS